jgi:phosphoglycerol transferase MdoB-like AlkP superfamily enzyme
MFKRLIFLALYWLSWIFFFQFFRIIFFIYHYEKATSLKSSLLAMSAWHGVRMDISFASYILVIPTLLMAFSAGNWKWYAKTLSIFSGLVAFTITLMVVIDLELFRAWGFRIDSTWLNYLKTPREALASMGAAPVVPLVLLFAALFLLTSKSLWIIQKRTISNFKRSHFLPTFLLFLFLTAVLIIPIRGGLQQIPLNESNAFFSNSSFANYAAVNVPWNFASSVLNNSYNRKNPFEYVTNEVAEKQVASLYKTHGDTDQYITTSDQKPNVLIIIWESFTAKAVESLGGVAGVTPHFDQLTREGILFRNLYASGNRSDKGMVSILSGYPAQPTQSIIKIPTKTATLPTLTQQFKKQGYATSFYYGGESEFANMKSYFLLQGFDRILDRHAFDRKDMNSKWGAHDHVVLNRLLTDLDSTKQPFFTTLFTLSSHEPFEVPGKTAIQGKDTEHLFLNAMHYADESIGQFIQSAKTKSWWNNTLIIIVADHGHPLPEKPAGKVNEFHIPMLWLGGALEKRNINIDTICSQTDLASTLLTQLQLPSDEFRWSNNIFMKGRVPFAYFAFTNGLGWIRPDGFIVRDNLGGNIIEKSGNLAPEEEHNARAYLQASFGDYLKR